MMPLIATGVYKARDIGVPGVGLSGVVPALDYLTASNRKSLGDEVVDFDNGVLNAEGRDVVVIGGDTAMDCVRTAIRQKARSVSRLYRRDRANMPGSQREVANAEEEGVEFRWLSAPQAFLGDNHVRAVQAQKIHLGQPDATGCQVPQIIELAHEIQADLVIKALGFDPEDLPTMFGAPELEVSKWGTIGIDWRMTSLPGVFAVGDIVRGASLVVWACAMAATLQKASIPTLLRSVSLLQRCRWRLIASQKAGDKTMTKMFDNDLVGPDNKAFDEAAYLGRRALNEARLTDAGVYGPQMEHDNCGVGFVAARDGQPTRAVVDAAIEALQAIWHRGAVDADGMTGDGAGIHIEIPRDFFIEHIARTGHADDGGRLAVGMVFLPRTDLAAQERCRCIVEQEILAVGHFIYGWRQVPVDTQALGDKAKATRPEIEQIMFSMPQDIDEEEAERQLYVVRRRIEKAVNAELISDFYICSMSSRSVIYKGMFLAEQVTAFFPDLTDERFVSSTAVYHQRYSTNTMPT